MPELPEVETVARLLRPALIGRTIVGGEVRWARTIAGMAPKRFLGELHRARVTGVGRRAKFVVIELARRNEPAFDLVGHLRMTGRMQVEPRDVDPGPFLRVALDLDDGRRFHFLDVRKFGRLWVVRDRERFFADLGPEPLGPSFTPSWLFEALRARGRRLKPLLLDQTFVAGLGNIYVDESLFRAGLHPLASSASVTLAGASRLHAAIRSTLSAAIEREGSSFDAFYRTPEGNPGRYQDEFQVYGRAGEPCRACAQPIQRSVVGQRGTHWCRRCQPRTRVRSRA